MEERFFDDPDNGETKSFSELLDEYGDADGKDIRTGDRITGEIISIGQDQVFVNTRTKTDGVVERQELLDEEGNLTCSVGDEIDLYVVSADENEIRLSKTMSGDGSLNMLKDAYMGRVPVEGRVLAVIKGGFHVEIAKKRAFCPVSQMDTKYIETPEDYLGMDAGFLITQLEDRGRNIVVSRRVLLAEEEEKAKEAFLSGLQQGDIIKGRITRLMNYGVFVEICPGVEGLVHISEMSWSRVAKPSDLVSQGDTIQVKVLDLEKENREKGPKISLSMKQTGADPWENVSQTFSPGMKTKGRVVRLQDFGAFVEIAPGVDGLVHISEMSYVKRVHKPGDMVSTGEEIDVMIKDVDPEKKRISLSMRDAEGDPWIDAESRFPAGNVVTGVIEKKERFGYFVSIEPGITGLLPKKLIERSADPGAIEKLKENDFITVKIETVFPEERKISLCPADAGDSEDWRKYASDLRKKETRRENRAEDASPANKEDAGLGSLGEKLKAAMDKKSGEDKGS